MISHIRRVIALLFIMTAIILVYETISYEPKITVNVRQELDNDYIWVNGSETFSKTISWDNATVNIPAPLTLDSSCGALKYEINHLIKRGGDNDLLLAQTYLQIYDAKGCGLP